MQDIDEPKPRTHRSTIPIILVLAAAIIGATSGILIADRDLLMLMKENISGRLASFLGNRRARVHAADAEQEISALRNPQATMPQGKQTSKAIPIGLSSIGAIRYSLQSDSVHVDFDLESTNLIGTGVLDSPDRIYLDLQEGRGIPDTLGRPKAQKAVSINGDPVTGVRIVQWESGTTRLVLDLSRSCSFTHRILPGSPPRLILEIRPRATGASASK